jgi:hypothetical protein
MTRTQIINYVTAKLGLTDSATQTLAGTFFDARHAMIWNEENWRQTRYQGEYTVAAGTQDITLDPSCEFVIAARWAGRYELLPTSGVAALQMNAQGYDQGGPVLAFEPLGKDSSGACTIRLLQIPQQSANLLILGKKTVVPLSGGDNTPIPGEDQALCEFVMADLYEWLRQASKAQYYLGKAGILLQKMKDIETAQSGEIRRIIPVEQVLDNRLGWPDSMTW